MSELRDILKEEYKKKAEISLTPRSLMEMIEEALNVMPTRTVIVEGPSTEGKSRTYTIKQIPLIPISELGWADNEDGNQGGTQRSLLENWLQNIDGTTFKQKLDNVSLKMEEGFGEIPATGDVQYIQQVMSYLVFFKTLTMAITNFNASAAGFNFESFLAALMNGSQIAAGGNTIADFVGEMDGQPTPISLKLYTKGQLEVGGSFFDLAEDMLEPEAQWASNPEYAEGGILYLVCTKDFSEWKEEQKGKAKPDPLTRKGTIDFYQFPITRRNLFSMLAPASDASRRCVASSAAFMAAMKKWRPGMSEPALTTGDGQPVPPRSSKGSREEVVEKWKEYLTDKVSPMMAQEKIPTPEGEAPAWTPEQISAIIEAMTIIYNQQLLTLTPEATEEEPTPSPVSFMKLAADGALSNAIKKALKESGYVPPQGLGIAAEKRIYNTIRQNVKVTFTNFKKDVIKETDKFSDAINTIEWVYDPETLITWYNSLSPEGKAIAIQNTRGFITRGHWHIPDAAARRYGSATDPEGKTGPLASIKIGAPYVQDILEKAAGPIMDEVFSIFENMAKMPDDLNSFFANGLKAAEKPKAEAGAKAGEAAAKTARKVAGRTTPAQGRGWVGQPTGIAEIATSDKKQN